MRKHMFVILIGLMLAGVEVGADGPLKPVTDKLFCAHVVPLVGEGAANAQALQDAYEMTGATAVLLRVNLAECFPKEPGTGPYTFDFSAVHSQPAMNSAKPKICWMDLRAGWSDDFMRKDPEGYWRFIGEFIRTVAERAGEHGIKCFSVADRGVDLSGTDWAARHVEMLRHVCPELKKAMGDSVLIAGGLSNGRDETVQALYDAGAKGLFDALDIQAVSPDLLGGPDMFQVISAHRAMVGNGDGAKKLFVGGGWAMEHNAPGLDRSSHKVAPSQHEIEAIRARLENGFRNLLTERDIYDPDWILGAAFFAFNDHYDSGGKFLPVGLVDFSGKPKGDLLHDFLPRIPEHTLRASLSAAGPAFSYVVDQPHSLELRLANLSAEEMALGSFSVRCVGAGNPAISATPVGEVPKSVGPGGNATATMSVTLPEETAGKRITLIVELDYTVKDRKHKTDCWLTLVPTSQFELTLLPARAILDGREQAGRIGMSVINHTGTEFDGVVGLTPCRGLKVEPAEKAMKINAYGLEAFVFAVSPESKAAPGHYHVDVDVGGKAKDWLAVDIPVFAKQLARPVKLDGKLDEWAGAASVTIARYAEQAAAKPTYENVGKATFTYDDANLYLAVQVDDDEHVQTKDGFEVVREDSVQVGFDPLIDGARTASGGYRPDDSEYAFAARNNSPSSVRLVGASGAKPGPVEEVKLAFAREGKKSVYEIALPWKSIVPFAPETGKSFAVGIAVNDSDGMQTASVEWGGGLVGGKDPRLFVPVVLSE